MTLSVLCAGELMWDLHAQEGASLEAAASFTRVAGGAAANVALALVAEGVEAGVAGIVSDDAMGRGLRDALAARGVDVSALVFHPGRTGLVFIDGHGDRFVSYRPERVDPPPLPLANRFSGGVLHIAALDPDEEGLEALVDLAARARADRATITLDVNARPRAFRDRSITPALRAVVGRADVVKVSDDDLRVLAIRDEIDDVRAALGMAADATLVITRGPGALSVAGPWGSYSRDPDRVATARRVGAGDAFCAGLIAALLASAKRGLPFWRSAIDRAIATAHAHVAGC
jgi:sugar/nucleoside kinase (ribokinase family)